MPRVRALPLAQDEPLHGHPRRAEPGPPARRDPAHLARRRADPPLHGHEHVRRVHGDPRDRAGQGARGGAAGPLRAVRLRPLDRHGRGDVHGQGRTRRDLRRLRRGHGRPRRGRGRAAAGRRTDHLRGPLGGPARARAGPGRDGHLDRRPGHRPEGARRDRRLRRRLHVRGHRPGQGHAAGGRVRAHGLGPVHGHGRGGQGRDARRHPALPDHRPARGRLSFGGVKGRDQVPQLVQLYLDGKLDVDPFISHRITLDEVNKGFDLMHDQNGIRSVIEFWSPGRTVHASRSQSDHALRPRPPCCGDRRPAGSRPRRSRSSRCGSRTPTSPSAG